MTKKVIKIKIELENTTIWYNDKLIKSRWEAIKLAIDHLESILEETRSR